MNSLRDLARPAARWLAHGSTSPDQLPGDRVGRDVVWKLLDQIDHIERETLRALSELV
jgi:hypothetical protein